MLTSSAAPTRTFVGRERELGLLGGLVEGAAVVRGEAGIGKTALLRQLAARTAAGLVLWVPGAAAEQALPFAAAAHLLLPLRDVFDQLPDVQRDALEISLALRSGPAVNPLAVCAAALGVLGAAGAAEPVLVVVDDFQWVDPESRQVLLFVARRLVAQRVVMVLALRDQPDVTAPGLATLPTLHLSGLTMPECRVLVAGLGIEVSPGELVRVVEQAGGNPLALIETVRGALPGGWQGGGGAQVWSEVIEGLPELTRVALCVVAASHSAALDDLGPALTELGVTLADLVPAERSGLLRITPRAAELRPPLLRAVILETTPLCTRLAAYQALARHAEGSLRPWRAWYQAASQLGPDDAVAEDLVAAATAARQRGEPGAAGRICHRAAELTAEPRLRAERLLCAARDALVAGQCDLARIWCEEALAVPSGTPACPPAESPAEPPVDLVFAADVELVRARARIWWGQPLRAADDLIRGAQAVRQADPQRAALLCAEAATPLAMAGRITEALATAQRGAVGGSPHSVVTLAGSLVRAGRTAQARRCLAAVGPVGGATTGDPHTARGDMYGDLHRDLLHAQSRVWLEEHDSARTLFSTMIETARQAGTPTLLAAMLCGRATAAWWTGHWAAACADASEALRRAEELGQVTSLGYALTVLARLDAARGELARCHVRADQAGGVVGSYGIDSLRVDVASVRGLAELGAGDLDAATHHLDEAWRAAQDCGLDTTTVVPFGGDLVEAHIRAGNLDRAALALAWLEERATAAGLVYPATAAARCRGLLAEDLGLATSHFAEARMRHQRCAMPFEQARTLLCEGETLRRLRRPAAARPLLRQAHTLFVGLGARPWAARAENELAATGARLTPAPNRRRPGLEVLTPQELQIARSVADGHNNIETAAALFVSRKTVEAHLTRIYRKLGVRSRFELAQLVARGSTGRAGPGQGAGPVAGVGVGTEAGVGVG